MVNRVCVILPVFNAILMIIFLITMHYMHYHLDDCDYQQHSRLHRIAVGMSTGQTWFCSLKPRHQTHNPFSLSTAWGGRCQWTGQWFPGCPSWDALDRKI